MRSHQLVYCVVLIGIFGVFARVGLSVLVLVVRGDASSRLANPEAPSIYDEFSYLLLQQPTYASRFPPAQRWRWRRGR